MDLVNKMSSSKKKMSTADTKGVDDNHTAPKNKLATLRKTQMDRAHELAKKAACGY